MINADRLIAGIVLESKPIPQHRMGAEDFPLFWALLVIVLGLCMAYSVWRTRKENDADSDSDDG